jgi:hypothetical protein
MTIGFLDNAAKRVGTWEMNCLLKTKGRREGFKGGGKRGEIQLRLKRRRRRVENGVVFCGLC